MRIKLSGDYIIKVIICVLMLLNMAQTHAQSRKEIEYKFKAAYIFNFLQFITWPPSAFKDDHSPVLIGVLGVDPFGEILDETMQSEKINGRSIVIKRSRQIKELDSCHIVFISDSKEQRVSEILKRVNQIPVLTISDIEGFGEQGGIINFYLKDNKIRFAINQEALNKSGIQISSKLLRLAKIINPI